METSRLRWQCRRGMRELDQLLVRYLEQRYERADDDEKAAFQSLLALSDPQLLGYLLNKTAPAPEHAIVVRHILDRTDT
jgi:antitoxin CptB